MSISGALASALSGLSVAARGAELVSNNVANARTEGYARRELQLAAGFDRVQSGGVRVTGVARHGDPQLLSERRGARAAEAGAGLLAAFHSDMQRILGTPDAPGSLTARLAELEASLVSAASRPDSPARLQAVAAAADALAGHLNKAGAAVQLQRREADQAIADGIDTLNASLSQVAHLNARIVRLDALGQDASALIDQRQTAIDRIAELVPVREVPRAHGRVALFTPGGAILVDDRAGQLGFAEAGVITPDMTLLSGALSGLTLNGRALATGEPGPMAGGRLSALFALRDEHAPALQARLDAVARDLVERFADPATDPSRPPGDPGILTDAGGAFVPANEAGLAGRLAINPLVAPGSDGLWRLRDGVGAAAPGDPGDARGLIRLSDALASARVPASGGFGAMARSAAGLAGDLVSRQAVERGSAEAAQGFHAAEAETLSALEARNGVDTDAELQTLMLIERTYAANARVISTVDEMIAELLRI